MSGSSFLTQVAALARRSTVRTLRQPAVIALVVVLALWTVYGLRRAEKAG